MFLFFLGDWIVGFEFDELPLLFILLGVRKHSVRG